MNQENIELKDFKKVGEILKQKREEHSYTLEHVAEITRITLSNLRFIEEGNTEMLPALVFVRGFVRNYANLLGLDSDWMVEVLNRIYEQSEGIEKYDDDSYSGTKSGGSDKTYLTLAVGILVILIVAAVFSFGINSSKDDSIEVIEAIEAPKANAVQAKATIESSVISPLNLVLMSNSSDWVYLVVDAKKTLEVQLEPNKKYEWPANEGYELTMTTGASAKVYLNGEELEIKQDQKDQLYEVKLNKFSLTQMNNQTQ
ncbi:MAG: helix-turn-helix domain-containing protein [SAR324 cluster bacterium]|nr:helix-turn-helix domain-containing protein [SAR324 cluster bacterium]